MEERDLVIRNTNRLHIISISWQGEFWSVQNTPLQGELSGDLKKKKKEIKSLHIKLPAHKTNRK